MYHIYIAPNTLYIWESLQLPVPLLQVMKNQKKKNASSMQIIKSISLTTSGPSQFMQETACKAETD